MNGKVSLQLGPGMATIGKDIALPGEDTAPKPAATPTVAVMDVGQTHISCDRVRAFPSLARALSLFLESIRVDPQTSL